MQIQNEAAPIEEQEPTSNEINALTQIVAVTKGKSSAIPDVAVRNFVDQALTSIEGKLEKRKQQFDDSQKAKQQDAKQQNTQQTTTTAAAGTTTTKPV